MCIAIVFFPGCEVINFEINLIFQLKSYFYMTKKSIQKFKYPQNEKRFLSEIKNIFQKLPQILERAFNIVFTESVTQSVKREICLYLENLSIYFVRSLF